MAGLAEIIAENHRLRELLQVREAELAVQQQQLREHEAKLAEQGAMLDALRARAEELARALQLLELKAAGPASQRFVPDEQAVLPFPGDVAPPPRMPQPEPESDDPPKSSKKRKRTPKRRNRDAFAHLPNRPVHCTAPAGAACQQCGGLLAVVGQAHSFRINWIPGHFIREDIVADKCACPQCPSQGVLTVPPPYALSRSLCANGLLARVLVDKFADHLPLNRQVRRMAREGFDVRSNTLASWVKRGARLLRVVANAVRAQLLGGSFLLGDDTGYPVQDAGDGQLRKGRFWAFTDQQQVFYAFTPSKKGEHPAELLADFAGHLLLVDGGSEFNQVVRDLGLERAGCWSHLRTYFFDARHHHPVEATLALGTLRDLFLLERSLHGLSPQQIRDARQAQAKPLIDGFFTWVQRLSTHARPKSKLAQALTYAQNQESALRLYLNHGELPMHNNLSELMLRQVVVGRKNWLFSRSEGGAEAAATVYTLVGSCMLQGIDPHTYLVDILDRLLDHPINRVAELTPAAWRLERERTRHPVAAA